MFKGHDSHIAGDFSSEGNDDFFSNCQTDLSPELSNSNMLIRSNSESLILNVEFSPHFFLLFLQGK